MLYPSQNNELMFSLINASWFLWPVCSFKFTAFQSSYFLRFINNVQSIRPAPDGVEESIIYWCCPLFCATRPL